MKTYELFAGDELRIAEKIQRRRYQLLVHSCIYYVYDDSVISDVVWSNWAKELQHLQSQYPQIAKEVALHEYFEDWDGSSGAFLPVDLSWVMEKAKTLLRIKNTEKVTEKPKVAVKKKLF